MTLPASVLERVYVSRFASDPLGLQVYIGGVLADPDALVVTATMVSEATTAVVFSEAATRLDVGSYEVVLTSGQSSSPGMYTLQWTYDVATLPQEVDAYIEVGPSSPAYDGLSPDMKGVVENVWVLFADLFDSPDGGPNLLTYFQSNWGRGRLAQLLSRAMGILNTTAQPYQTYTIGGPGEFPVAQWGSLLEEALYVEALKHLVRSYTEDPVAENVIVARMSRRDYMMRWQSILADEREQLRLQLEVFKIANMGLGSGGRVLVAGGVFGNYSPTRYANGSARPRLWSRWY